MTKIIEREEFRNNADNATIVVEQYADKFSVPMWRYFVKYDVCPFPTNYTAGLQRKPTKRVLQNRF